MKKQDVVQELRVACSVATFESTKFAEFRTNLALALRVAIDAAGYSSSSSIVQYRESDLEEIFWPKNGSAGGVPWSGLMAHHDHQTARHETMRVSALPTTPLQVILNEISNPTVVPVSCRSILIMALVRASVEVVTPGKIGSDNPSRQVLVSTVGSLLTPGRCPSVANAVSQLLLSYLKETYQTENIVRLAAYSVERTNRLVWVLQHLAKLCHEDLGVIVLQCLLTLIQRLDDADVTLLESGGKANHEKNLEWAPCHHCEIRLRPMKKRRVLTLQQLHDYSHGGDGEDASETDHVPGLPQLPRKDANVDDAALICTCHPVHASLSGVERSRVSAITRLPPSLVFLRARLYQRMLATCTTLGFTASDARLQRNTQQRQDWAILQSVVDLACQHANSSSLRFAAVLLADSFSSRGFHLLIRILWERYEQGTTNDEMLLRWYAELIVQCSHFDDPSRCWDALRPLSTELSRRSSSQGNESDNSRIRLLLRCFSSIQCGRRRTLLFDETNGVVREGCSVLVTRLALAFGDARWWVHDGMDTDERERVIHALQAIGVLGFVEDTLSYEPNDSTSDDAQCYRCWPFPAGRCLRSSSRRVGPNVGRPGIFSSPSKNRNLDDMDAGEASVRVHADHELRPTSLMDYLNDDVLRVMFSFLGYKRLIRASGVCKSWNSLSNEDCLWRQTYELRYLIANEDSKIAEAVSNGHANDLGSWKTLFIQKFTAERGLRFRRNAAGWKHRTCSRLGCLMVIRSPFQLKRHEGAHKKRSNQDSSTHSRSKTTKRRRQEAADPARLLQPKLPHR